MESNTLPHGCQIQCLNQMSEPLGRVEVAWQFRSRLMRIIKRRWHYIVHQFLQLTSSRHVAPALATSTAVSPLQAGDQVRVKSRAEIEETLNQWNRLKGTAFMEEMWPYCGTTHQVLKRLDRFLDERDYHIKKCRGIVLLDGAICEGTKDFGRCDRSCFFFWREEWLEKIG
jgi:hypothetical protein